jgi:drug/metabolite transporter (DMT)-like permease
MLAAGILHFVWGATAIPRDKRSAQCLDPLQQLDFPFKLGLAIVFLGETLTPLRIFGIALIMLGGAIAMPRRLKKKRGAGLAMRWPGQRAVAAQNLGAAAAPAVTAKPVFVPSYLEGYTFAALSITCYGLSPLFLLAALENTSIGTSLAGGFISMSRRPSSSC